MGIVGGGRGYEEAPLCESLPLLPLALEARREQGAFACKTSIYVIPHTVWFHPFFQFITFVLYPD
jgi:hypothetical protein